MAKDAPAAPSQAEHCRALARHLRSRIPALHSKDAQIEFGFLYAGDDANSPVDEKHWAALIKSLALGHYGALHALYKRTHRLVFTLIMRMTNNRHTAEELTLDTFHDVWRLAGKYDAGVTSVVGWIMKLARFSATAFERGQKRSSCGADDPSRGTDAADSEDSFELLAEILLPSEAVWERLARRIARETGEEQLPFGPEISESQWEAVAPGISCQLLATDTERDRVSMLVRLGAGIAYPPYTHAGVEELHLLHGELWINDRKLHPGDYNRASRGTGDMHVWSATGCTCVLITSSRDLLL